MKFRPRFLALALLAMLPSGLDARKTVDDTKAGLNWLDAGFATYDAIQKAIFEYAEPGYQEYRSSEELASHLESNGFAVERGAAGIPTAFVATFGSGGPVVGLLAEYDALPGQNQDTTCVNHPAVPGAPGHACGHNLLGTATVASAVAISKWLALGHQGTVKLFGCPAEEGGGGKVYMTRAGCFDGCDAVFDWHPSTESYVSMSGGLANVLVNFTFRGTASHASVAPENGRSALDAVEAFDHMMNLMREHVSSDARIHYIITDGGQSANTVPERASVQYYIRHPEAETVRAILDRAIKAAEGAALGTGTTMSYELMGGNYERLINRSLAEVFLRNLVKVGGLDLDESELAYAHEMLVNSGISDFSVMEKMTGVDPVLRPAVKGGPSSDVGNVSQVAPLANLRYCACVPAGGSHSWQQASIGGTTIGTKALMNVARIFYLSALDLYRSPSLVQTIRDEYRSVRGDDFEFRPLIGDREPPFDYCK